MKKGPAAVSATAGPAMGDPGRGPGGVPPYMRCIISRRIMR